MIFWFWTTLYWTQAVGECTSNLIPSSGIPSPESLVNPGLTVSAPTRAPGVGLWSLALPVFAPAPCGSPGSSHHACALQPRAPLLLAAAARIFLKSVESTLIGFEPEKFHALRFQCIISKPQPKSGILFFCK